jgi:hypothetical protein
MNKERRIQMIRKFFGLLMAFALLGLIAGCSRTTSTTDDDLQSVADEFGGFTPSDEAPAFNDPELAAETAEDEEYADDVLRFPGVDSIIADDASGAYAIRIAWGSLQFDSTVTEVTDWSGSLSITRGAIVVRRLIKFERGQDEILERTDRKLVEWISRTTVHYDGIFCNLYVPRINPENSAAVDEPVTVTFDTEPFSISFDVSKLAALDTIYFLDDSVNAVAFRAHKIYPSDCPKGFLEGRWGRDSTGQGVFRGRWISNDGALAGHLKGRWGTDLDGTGQKVFYGKYIDITGRFRGLLRGRYMSHHNVDAVGNTYCHAGGWFYGHFYDENRNVKGVLGGHYMMPRNNSDRRAGFFSGRWKTYCPRSVEENDGFDG